MNTRLLTALLLAGCAAANLARADEAMYSCTRADGSKSLTNVPIGDHCTKMFNYQAPAPEAAAPAATAAPVPATPRTNAPAATAAAAPVAATADRPPPTGAAAGGGANGNAVPHDARGQRLANRRNAAIQESADAAASGQPGNVRNRAVNRRYLMTNRAEYIKANGAPQ